LEDSGGGTFVVGERYGVADDGTITGLENYRITGLQDYRITGLQD
jgi:hypothetical protein